MKRYKKSLSFRVKEVDTANAIVRGVFSTSDLDRQGEKIAKGSWLLDEYLLNPVVLWAHNHDIPAIGKTVELGYDENGDLAGAIQFAVGVSELANEVFNLYAGEYLHAWSVGFGSDDVAMEGDVVMLRQNTLYEISCVNVPANAYALAKSKGLNTPELDKFFRADNEKYGRVLSAKNRDSVQRARDALQSVLDADETDKSIADPKVVVKKQNGRTPLVFNKRAAAVSLINKAVRELLEGKRQLDNSKK